MIIWPPDHPVAAETRQFDSQQEAWHRPLDFAMIAILLDSEHGDLIFDGPSSASH